MKSALIIALALLSAFWVGSTAYHVIAMHRIADDYDYLDHPDDASECRAQARWSIVPATIAVVLNLAMIVALIGWGE